MNNFNDIIGYSYIKEHIKKAIQLDKISHAYIINGEDGMGKKLIANVLAKSLQCESSQIEPCNKCVSCIMFNSNNHPDVIYIRPEKIKNAKSTKSIGVDVIRQKLNKDINIKPYSNKYKIYIIEQAENLTVQAQNSMLKTIEEPPIYGIIILLTNNYNALLQTILSRCVLLNLRPQSDDVVSSYINNYLNVNQDEVDFFVSFCGGNIGKAKKLIESETFNEIRETCITMINGIYEDSIVNVLNKVKELENYKNNIEDFLDIMISWYRDILIIKALNNKDKLVHSDKYSLLIKQSSRIGYNEVGNIIELIQKTKQQLSSNVNFQLTLEALFLKIKES